jgi:hypothetical protein
MRRRPSPLLAAVIAAAVAILLPAGASARSKCEPRPKPSSAAPLVSIDLSGETVTPANSNVSVSPFDYGNEISLTVPNALSQRAYKLSIPLSSDKRLTVLSAGGAAITQTLPPAPGDDSGGKPLDEYQDGLDQVHDNGPITTTPGDGGGDTGAVIDDNQDPSWYPSGDDVAAATRDGSDIASDALVQVEQQVADGNYVMVAALDPPLATDANGRAVPVSLTRGTDGLVVSISPSSSTTFPIKVTLRYGYDPDSYDPSASDSSATSSFPMRARSVSARSSSLQRLRSRLTKTAAAKCSGERAQVVVSSSSGWWDLTYAFKANPAKCAVYNISVPEVKDQKTNFLLPRPKSARRVRQLNNKVKTILDRVFFPHWNTSGAAFKPVAEINYGAIENIPYSEAARVFAQNMKPRGYDMWSIDEAPCGLVNSPSGPSWQNLVYLVHGLSQAGEMKGIVFNCYRRQDDSRSNVISTKKNLKVIFSNKTSYDWSTLSATKLWAQESYTLCSQTCVKGTSLGQKAMQTNAYMQHPARLAFAPDAPTTPDAPVTVEPVRNLLENRYLPLINGWGRVKGNSNGNSYGTYDLSTEQIKQLASLQTYAARAWVRPSDNPYSALRIGVRWVNRLEKKNIWSHNKGWSAADRAALARRIARALAGSYGQNGTILGACDPTGGGSTKLCQPAVDGATFTDSWATFRRWNDTICEAPSNDDFAHAVKLVDSVSGTADGTTKCATLEQGETTPGGGSKSVWYRWTAPQDDDHMNFAAYDSDGYVLQTNVHTGDSLGNLHPVFRNFFDSYCAGLTVTGGTTYMIQVVNTRNGGETAPDSAFTLSWGRRICVE